MPNPVKVLIVHNIMAPYRFPLFRALARHSDIDLTVWFMSRSAKNRRWAQPEEDLGFDYKILPSIQFNYLSRDLFTYLVNYTFPWNYARQQFDVLISAGWLDFACQVGFVASKLLGRKYVLWSESTALELSWRRSLAKPLVKAMVVGADACIGVGTRSRQYLLSLGAQEQNLFTAFSTVDVDFFRRGSARTRPDRAQHKRALGIERKHVVLYCGQFIARKGLMTLLEAFALIKELYDDVALVLVGYGPARTELLSTAARLRLSDVHVLDHVEVTDMPEVYTLADVFVLPSLEETWGLVVNEAMACGLPVIVSERVGSSVDLVRDGENGFVVPPGDPATLADRCLRLLTDETLLTRLTRSSAERMAAFTPERAADEFVEAIHHAVRRP